MPSSASSTTTRKNNDTTSSTDGKTDTTSTVTMRSNILNDKLNDENNNDFQNKIDSLLKLVSNHSTGVTTDDQVEEAISSLLDSTATSTTAASTSSKVSTAIASSEMKDIVPDDDNYDDLGEENEEEEKEGNCTKAKASITSSSTKTDTHNPKIPKWTGKKATIQSLKEQDAELKKQRSELKKKTSTNNNVSSIGLEDNDEWKDLDEIPLGRICARMMVTFGDGPNPVPAACSAALLGTRQCLQNAVKDARALRRKMKLEYLRAKASANTSKMRKIDKQIIESNKQSEDGCIQQEFVFEAIQPGHAKIAMNVPCGFDDNQLEKLFPEEMFAYNKWHKMREDYKKSKEDAEGKRPDKKDDVDETANESTINSDDDEESPIKTTTTTSSSGKKDSWTGGHLQNRLAQFDIRTDHMKEDWYLAFSEVRQGSFISRSFLREDQEWEKKRKEGRKNGGRPSQSERSTWTSLPSPHVQFLHWIGFDPRSSLPPPSIQTTEALAFLGYDFMGKIVEKAIFLRYLRKVEQSKERHEAKPNFVLQLNGDEQLTREDINHAIQDSTVIAKPLYNTSNSVLGDESAEAVQLYFGPGFEERIEMEMEQIAMGKKKQSNLSDAEKEIRQKEDELFEKIKAPPKLLEGIMDVLDGDGHKTEAVLQKRKETKKKRRKVAEKRATALKRASMNSAGKDNKKQKTS